MGGGDILGQVLSMIAKFAFAGGSLWTLMGAWTFGGGLKEQNGPQTQSGMWQMIGGGIIVAAAALFATVAI